MGSVDVRVTHAVGCIKVMLFGSTQRHAIKHAGCAPSKPSESLFTQSQTGDHASVAFCILEKPKRSLFRRAPSHSRDRLLLTSITSYNQLPFSANESTTDIGSGTACIAQQCLLDRSQDQRQTVLASIETSVAYERVHISITCTLPCTCLLYTSPSPRD